MTLGVGGERIELRERTAELSALAELLTAVARERGGRIALVYGEAGIGKTSVVRAFCDSAAASANVLWGRCDELSTPRPLGPFVEIAETVEPPLAQTLRSASTPYEVATALTRHLGAGSPAVVVLEDCHLADEATLDVLRLLGSASPSCPRSSSRRTATMRSGAGTRSGSRSASSPPERTSIASGWRGCRRRRSR